MRRLTITAALLAACTQPATTIELDVAVPASLEIDSLAIVVADQRSSSSAADQLTLVVPDDWSGAPIRLEVEGLLDSAVVALGMTDVVPVRGKTISAVVQLVDAGCETVCTPGDARCEGDGVATCVIVDSCPTWSDAEACATDAPYCSNGACSATCSDECTAGTTSCDGNASVRSCGDVDADSCLDWISVACATDEHCTNGGCEPDADVCPGTCSTSYEPVNALTAITNDGAYVYWVAADGIKRRSDQTGVTETVVARYISAPDLGAIAVDGVHVYWLEDSGIVRVAKSGGPVQSFVSELKIVNFVIDAGHVYWIQKQGSSGAWSGMVKRRSKTGGTTQLLHELDNYPDEPLAVDDTHVYFTDFDVATDTGYIYSTKKDGSSSPTTLRVHDGRVDSAAVDNTHLYFLVSDYSTNGTTLERIPKGGGSSVLIGGVVGYGLQMLAIDSTHVVWTDSSTVYMRRKTGGPIAQIGVGSWYGYVTLTPKTIAWATGDVDPDSALDNAPTGIGVAPRCACEPP